LIFFSQSAQGQCVEKVAKGFASYLSASAASE
jgi:hypothetical protein